MGATRKDRFKSTSQFPPGDENTPATGQAFYTDIGAQPDNFPVTPPTRVRFAQPDHIIDGNIG